MTSNSGSIRPSEGVHIVGKMETTASPINLATPDLPAAPTSYQLEHSRSIDWQAVGKKIISLLSGIAIGTGAVFLVASNPVGWAILSLGVVALLANLIHTGLVGGGQKEVLSNLAWAAVGVFAGGAVTGFAYVLATATPGLLSLSEKIGLISGGVGQSLTPVVALFPLLNFHDNTREDSSTVEEFIKEHPAKQIKETLDKLMKFWINTQLETINHKFSNAIGTVPSEKELKDIENKIDKEELANAARKGWTLAWQLNLTDKQLTFFYQAAEVAHELGKDQIARPVLELLSNYNKKMPGYFVALSTVDESLGDHKKAIESMQKAIAIHKEKGLAYYTEAMNLARLYYKQGNTQAAIEALDEAINHYDHTDAVVPRLKAQKMLDSLRSANPKLEEINDA